MFNAAHRLIGACVPNSIATHPRSPAIATVFKGCAHTLDVSTSVALLIISSVAYDKAHNFIPRRYLQEIPQALIRISAKTTATIWMAATFAAFGLHLYFALQKEKSQSLQGNESEILEPRNGDGEDNSPPLNGPAKLSTKAPQPEFKTPRGRGPGLPNGPQTVPRPHYDQSHIVRTPRARSVDSYFADEGGAMLSPIFFNSTSSYKTAQSPGSPNSPGFRPFDQTFRTTLVGRASEIKPPQRTFYRVTDAAYAQPMSEYQAPVLPMPPLAVLKSAKDNLKSLDPSIITRVALQAPSSNPFHSLRRQMSAPQFRAQNAAGLGNGGVDPNEWNSPIKATRTSGQSGSDVRS